MAYEPPQPITIHESELVAEWARTLVGQRILGVRYLCSSETPAFHEHSTGLIHEVDQAVRILLSGGRSAVALWEMRGLVEGIGLRIQSTSEPLLELVEADVTTTIQWQSFLGDPIKRVIAAWHVPNEGCPNTLWSVRLLFSEGSAITIALGEIAADSGKYLPTALLVFFDDASARAYLTPASAETAFGPSIET